MIIENIYLNKSWKYAEFTAINEGAAKLYRASANRRDVIIGINAGHGTYGGEDVKIYSHPDKSARVSGDVTFEGFKTAAVHKGMTFTDGTPEAEVTLNMAKILREKLLNEGYDVLMLRDDADVRLDNIARTVIANNTAACMISLHWDSDEKDYDKGCFYIAAPDGLKDMEPVSKYLEEHKKLGEALIRGLREKGCRIFQNGCKKVDLAQIAYSCIPSVIVELGNRSSVHDELTLSQLADGLTGGIKELF